MSADFIKQCLYTLNSGSGAVPPGGVVWLPYEPTDWEQFRGELRDSGWFLCDGSYVEDVNIRYPEFAKHAKLMSKTRATVITGLNPEFKFNMTLRTNSSGAPRELTNLSWSQSFNQYEFIGDQWTTDTTYSIPRHSSDLFDATPSKYYPHVSTQAYWQGLWMLCCNLGWTYTSSASGVNQYSGSDHVTNSATILSEFATQGLMYVYTLADTSNWPLAEDCPTMLEALEKLAAASDEAKLSLFNQNEYRLNRWFTATEIMYTGEYSPEVLTAVDTAITGITKAKLPYSYSIYEQCGFGGLAKAGGLRFFNALRQAMVLSSKTEGYLFKLPDLLNYRTLMGYNPSVGIEEVGTDTVGAIPNPAGKFLGTGRPGSNNRYGAYNQYDTDSFTVAADAAYDGWIAASGHNGKSIYGYVHTFDPSRISNVYQSVDMVIPNGVRAIPVMKFY